MISIVHLFGWCEKEVGKPTDRDRRQRALVRLLVRLASILGVLLFLAQGRVADAATFTVTNTNDSGADSLRQAILDANTAPGADTIVFSLSGCPCTIMLMSGELAISDDLTITGPGASNLAVDGNHTSQVFYIGSSVTVTLSGLTIQNGSANSGGGIFNYFFATLTLINSTVSGNTAVFGAGGIRNWGTLTLNGSTVSDNTAGDAGGGIANEGTGAVVTINNSTVSGNSATDDSAGGIYNQSGTMTLTNSTISSNSAKYDGGGIVNADGTVTLGYVRDTCLCRARHKHVYLAHLVMSSKVGERMSGRDFMPLSST